MTPENPEIGRQIHAAGIPTNIHDVGEGQPLLLLHGSGPGVSAYANWRLNLPVFAKHRRVIAPDIVGFGFTERPAGVRYDMDTWVKHAVGVLDTMGLDKVDIVGNSFGGALTLALAVRHPERVRRLVLMGAAGAVFPLTDGLDTAWGYTPSLENMRTMLDIFAYNRNLVTDELARVRYEASLRPGVQEAYAAMFPAPRQRWIEALASPEPAVRALPHEVMLIHGREDRVVPLESSLKLLGMIPRAQLHVFGQCGHWTQIEHAARFCRLVLDFTDER
ncbi:MAG: alpha/beta fold hydrolase [Panacagrimonas sp.]